jgi:5-methylcytosine-specific restriction endonuclease McrA
MSDEARREYYTEASNQFQQLRSGQELTEQQKDKLRRLAEKMNAQEQPLPKSSEVDGDEILQEVENAIGLEWYELLTTTSFPHPMPANTFMAYWSTRDGKHLSLWNPSDVIVTLFNKRVFYLQEFQQLSREESFGQASEEFGQLNLGQESRHCEYCGNMFNPSSGLGGDLNFLDRDDLVFKLQRKTCSEECSLIRTWQISVREGMLPDAEFDKTITWDAVWQRFGPYCYICGQESIYNQEDLDLRMGTKAWKARWGDYRRGDPSRDAVVEHVYPRSKGGTHTWDNVRISCTRCNLIKGDSIPPSVK